MANTITASQKAKLNKMNKAAQLVGLGTLMQAAPITGSWVVTASQSNGSAITIPVALSTINTFVVQINRSGSFVPTFRANASGSTINVLPVTGSYVVTTGDVISYFVS